MESVKQREGEWNEKLKLKDYLVEEEQYKNKQLEDKIEELKKELDLALQAKNKVGDIQLSFEAELDKKNETIHGLEEEIEKLKDDV